MPATPANIARAIRAARVVTRSDSAIQAAFPDARDQLDAPRPGYFELAADGETALELVAQLIGVRRRRFVVEIDGLVWLDPADGVPTWHLTDAELGVDDDMLLTRIEVDMESETTTVELWG
ncbi:MAG: hypothetical protein AB7G24_00765 [Novosphingobium sp.]